MNDRITFQQIKNFIDFISPTMDDYLYVCDFEQDYYYISEQALKRFALPSQGFYNVVDTLESFVYPEDYPALREDLLSLPTDGRSTHNLRYRWLDLSRRPIWINCRGRMFFKDGKALFLIGCINEIGARQQADNISGLLGEASLEDDLKKHLPNTPKGYILLLGIDDLKGVNARLGMEYGDMILSKTAEYISESLMPGQKLYRVFGDQFMVVDVLNGTREGAKLLYNHTRQNIERFIESNNYEAVFTLSGGLLLLEDVENPTYSTLMMLAEFTLNEAKRLGRNRCYVFCQEDYNLFLRKRQLRRQLRRAINHGFEGFDVYYQPLINAKTNRYHGAEALMRFSSPEYGIVSPAEFIPILEETGLIIPAGRWIIRQALGACRRFQKLLPGFRIGINLSPVQIMKSYVGNDIVSAIQEFNLNPSYVAVELTESSFLESDSRFRKTWQILKRAGVQIALDDFGSGYSNFRYLTELDPDIIKIDRLFTIKAMENEFELKILSLFCEMAHSLQLRICVEGVETAEELQKIVPLVPEYIQGYYFSKPCPYEQFYRQLEADTAGAEEG